MLRICDVKHFYTTCLRPLAVVVLPRLPMQWVSIVSAFRDIGYGAMGYGSLYGMPGFYAGSHVLGSGYLRSFLRNDGVVFAYVAPTGIEDVVEYTQMVVTPGMTLGLCVSRMRKGDRVLETRAGSMLFSLRHRHLNFFRAKVTWPDPDGSIIHPGVGGGLSSWLRQGSSHRD